MTLQPICLLLSAASSTYVDEKKTNFGSEQSLFKPSIGVGSEFSIGAIIFV
jgi:hypothetical protein